MKINLNRRYAALANCFLIYFILLAIICLTGCTSTQVELDKEWKDHWCSSVASWEIEYCDSPEDCEVAERQLKYFKDGCK